MKLHEILAVADATTAILIAAGFLIACLVHRKTTAFRWWAACFALIAVSVFTATLRMPPQVHWAQLVCWVALYVAVVVMSLGVCAEDGRSGPAYKTMIAGAGLLGGIVVTLSVLNAPPPFWFYLGPLPSVLLLLRCGFSDLRAQPQKRFDRVFGLMLVAFAGVIIARSLTFAGLFVPPPLRPRPPLGGLALGPGHVPGHVPGFGPGFGAGPGPGLRAGLGIPPRPPGFGQLAGMAPPPPPITQPLIISLVTILAIIGLAIFLALRVALPAMERLRKLSTTDGMTGLLNRRAFDEQGAEILKQAKGLPVCAILLDVDHFKKVNDVCGHAAGDRVITALGRIIGEMTDGGQMAGRIGGEEFAIILPKCNLAAGRLFAEAVRTRFMASDYGEDIPWTLTLSAGVAAYEHGERLHALLARADKALYLAKDNGRNRVMMAPEMVKTARHARMA